MSDPVQHVPFFGMTGDYESDHSSMLATWLDLGYTAGNVPGGGQPERTCHAFPAAFFNNGQGVYKQGRADHVFTMGEDDLPRARRSHENPMRDLTVDVFHANEDGTKGELLTEFAPFYYSDGRLPPRVPIPSSTCRNRRPPPRRIPRISRRLPTAGCVFEAVGTRGVGAAQNGENTDTWVSEPFIVREVPVDPGAGGPRRRSAQRLDGDGSRHHSTAARRHRPRWRLGWRWQGYPRFPSR